MEIKKTYEQLSKKEIIDVINKDWMTHDGLWFALCLKNFGSDKANRLNLEAIELLAQMETFRMKRLLQIEGEAFSNMDELKTFFDIVREIFIPDFMGSFAEYKDDSTLVIGMKPGACFAKKGMMKLDALFTYQCGVLYRIECMLKSLGLRFTKSKSLGRCLELEEGEGACRLEFNIHFD